MSELKGNRRTYIQDQERKLGKLSNYVNIFDPTAVTLYTLNLRKTNQKELSNGYKVKLVKYYSSFCKANQIPFDKPRIIYEPPIQIIPTTEQVNQIINSAHESFACIFTILAETAVEQAELHRTPIVQINTDKGEISVNGTKLHSNGTYLLKEHTANMLRLYLTKHSNEEYPFPTPKAQRQAWTRARKRASKNLTRPELLKIPLKNLRNYAGAQVWLHGYRAGYPAKDAIAVMRFMRHKRLEMTLHYIRSINLDEPLEYNTVAIQLGTPDTQKQIIEHANAGYEKITDADGYIYMRIRK